MIEIESELELESELESESELELELLVLLFHERKLHQSEDWNAGQHHTEESEVS